MATWTVSGITFLDPSGVSASSTSGGNIYTAGSYWMGDISVQEQQYERRRVAIPGQDGYRSKKYGSRGRTINGEVFYVAATVQAVYDDFLADRDSLLNQLFDTTPPYRTVIENCELVSFPDAPIMTLADGKYFMKTMLTIFSLD
jgi:hypothetical protein